MEVTHKLDEVETLTCIGSDVVFAALAAQVACGARAVPDGAAASRRRKGRRVWARRSGQPIRQTGPKGPDLEYARRYV